MNSALEEIKNIYKPYRLTKKKNITIIDSTSGSFVIKKNHDNKVSDAYNYLLSRSFDYFPKLITTNTRGDINVFEYIDEVNTPKEQKALDMIDLVSLLHNKTTYYKEVTEDNYKEIYENLKNNIIYAKNYYDNLYNIFIEEIYHSPSHYLLIRNIYKLFAALNYASNELDEWYDKIKTTNKTRVAYIHNNLESDHFIKNTKSYLISWDKSKIDSPLLDLITFYNKEYMNYDFESLFKRYFKSYPLTELEKKLLFIVISIPPLIEFSQTEIENVKLIRQKLDYVFKTEILIKNLSSNVEDI